jgi:ribose 1,5-bisphosphokinase PhnN
MLHGLAIGGRMGSGKDYLYGIIRSYKPSAAQVKFSYFIWREAKRLGLVPPDADDSTKSQYREALQSVPNPHHRFQAAAVALCRLHVMRGRFPVICDVRKEADQAAVVALGYPLIVCTAPREVRIQRIMARDRAPREEVTRYIDDHATESAVDDLVADHTFINDGRRLEYELARLFRFLADCSLGGRIASRCTL